MSPLRRCCRLPVSFSRSFVAPLGLLPELPTHGCPDPAPSAGAWVSSRLGGLGQQVSGGQQLAASVQRFPVRATASHRPYLRFLIAPHAPDALRCISWLFCVIAIKLLLLEVPSMVSGMRLESKPGFGQWGIHKERGGVLGCPHSTKASIPPE